MWQVILKGEVDHSWIRSRLHDTKVAVQLGTLGCGSGYSLILCTTNSEVQGWLLLSRLCSTAARNTVLYHYCLLLETVADFISFKRLKRRRFSTDVCSFCNLDIPSKLKSRVSNWISEMPSTCSRCRFLRGFFWLYGLCNLASVHVYRHRFSAPSYLQTWLTLNSTKTWMWRIWYITIVIEQISTLVHSHINISLLIEIEQLSCTTENWRLS